MINRRRRRILYGLTFAGAGLGTGWLAGRWSGHWPFTAAPHPSAYSIDTGPTIQQVQSLSTLVTIRVDVADVQETHLNGRTGGVRAAVLVKGDFLLGTDLGRAVFKVMDRSERRAVLVLPQPRVTSPRLDLDRTRIFSLAESGLWLITPMDERTAAAVIQRAYRDAQKLVAHAAADPMLVDRARRQAEAVLATFFSATGWSVTVQWSD